MQHTQIKIYDDKIYIPSSGQYCNLNLSCKQLKKTITTLECKYIKQKIERIQANPKQIQIINTINTNPDSILDYYMPILNNNTWLIEKYEALVRLNLWWKIIYPFDFLSLIENTPLELKVSELMLEKAINKLIQNHWIKISLNLTWNDLANDSYINKMKYLLQKNKIKKWRLNVELLETVSNTNNGKSLEEIIKIFNSFWVNVYIDDMWTWNSNINRLLHVKNIHMVKIDWWIIQWLSNKNFEWETDEKKEERIQKAKEIITLIVQIAENQEPKQKVVAEYVSNENIFNEVKKLWIHYSQWFYIWEASKDLIQVKNIKIN